MKDAGGEGISKFSGDNRFLSNFYLCNVPYENIEYPSSEHAYQAAKCAVALNRLDIQRAPTPADAKRFGRRVKIRRDWEEVKIEIMKKIVLSKFQTNPTLRKMLMDTGTAHLEEGNYWGDTFWGVVGDEGVGENHLGKILMEVRDLLREEYLRERMETREFDEYEKRKARR